MGYCTLVNFPFLKYTCPDLNVLLLCLYILRDMRSKAARVSLYRCMGDMELHVHGVLWHTTKQRFEYGVLLPHWL
eukprot:1074309-Amphidinium_carterae.1